MAHVIGLAHEFSRPDAVNVLDESTWHGLVEKPVRKSYSVPIGPYDQLSITNYDDIKYRKEHAPGTITKLSEGDVICIKLLYEERCSYDIHHGMYSQLNFECIQCFGKNSEYGVCLFCLKNCHSACEGGYVVHRADAKGFECDCGKFSHNCKQCTFLVKHG